MSGLMDNFIVRLQLLAGCSSESEMHCVVVLQQAVYI